MPPPYNTCVATIGAFGKGCAASGIEDLLPGIGVGLLSAQPNPLVDGTTIVFGLAEDALIDLAVYDVGGRCVRHLASRGACAAGVHRVAWGGGDDAGRAVPAGVYVCRLSTGAHVWTRSLILLR